MNFKQAIQFAAAITVFVGTGAQAQSYAQIAAFFSDQLKVPVVISPKASRVDRDCVLQRLSDLADHPELRLLVEESGVTIYVDVDNRAIEGFAEIPLIADNLEKPKPTEVLLLNASTVTSGRFNLCYFTSVDHLKRELLRAKIANYSPAPNGKAKRPATTTR